MESVDYEPVWTVMAQLVVLILNAVLYARQKSAVDVEKRDRGEVRLNLDIVRQIAESAKAEAQAVNAAKYERVYDKCQEVLLELSSCKTANAALQETVSSLSNKLASRDRADRRAAKATEDDPARETAAAAPGGTDLDELLRTQGMRLAPEPPVAPAAPAAPPRRFGAPVRPPQGV